jgi:O-antigen/teichoic acid export membrane protein
MGKYRRLGKNTLLVFVGNMGARVIGLLMLPFYTRWLSVEDYGTTDIINAYVSLLLGLVSACIADSDRRERAIFHHRVYQLNFLMVVVRVEPYN